MLKKLHYLFLLFAFSGYTQSETSLSVTETVPFKDESHTYEILTMKTTEEGFTGLVRQGKRDLAFDIFDSEQKNIFSEVVDIERKEKYIGDVFHGNEFKIITVIRVNKMDREIYCHSFNLKTKTLNKQLLFKTSVKRKQELFYVSNKRQTSVAISPNGQFMVIATDDYNKNTN